MAFFWKVCHLQARCWASALTAAPSAAGMHTKRQLGWCLMHDLCGRFWGAWPTAVEPSSTPTWNHRSRLSQNATLRWLVTTCCVDSSRANKLGVPISTWLVHCSSLQHTEWRGRQQGLQMAHSILLKGRRGCGIHRLACLSGKLRCMLACPAVDAAL